MISGLQPGNFYKILGFVEVDPMNSKVQKMQPHYYGRDENANLFILDWRLSQQADNVHCLHVLPQIKFHSLHSC